MNFYRVVDVLISYTVLNDNLLVPHIYCGPMREGSFHSPQLDNLRISSILERFFHLKGSILFHAHSGLFKVVTYSLVPYFHLSHMIDSMYLIYTKEGNL